MTFKLTVKDKTWVELAARVNNLGKQKIKVGVLASTAVVNSTGGTSRINMIELAAIHEFGSPAARIPARSFIRSTFAIRRVVALRTICGKLVKQIVLGKLDVTKALNILGSWSVAEVKNTITEIDIPPPLAQATIDAKGSSKPLVDTGRLLNSISYEVVPA